jgi:adenosylcobinamide kinase/adenosylcobinamide-phosphate guanylyltransferase
MGKTLTLILGGARSGKSSHAQQLAREYGDNDVLFVATAQALDDEMRMRIESHRVERPAAWRTLEAPRHAGEAITHAEASAIVVVDCLTLLIGNAVLALPESASVAEAEAAALAEVEELIAAYHRGTASWIVISNEVGWGIVPSYPVGRSYRDALGRANQQLAAESDRVVLMVAGIPMRVR